MHPLRTSIRARAGLVAASLLFASCVSAATSLKTADGRTRTWREHAPKKLPTGPMPVIIVLHGGGGSAKHIEDTSGFDAAADTHGFLAVYPEGIGRGRFHTWNASPTCCGAAQEEHVDDVAFLAALVDRLGKAHKIDKSRVFVVGHSNGAVMAERALCERPDVFAGAVIVASPGLNGVCKPKEPRRVLIVHGTADKCASYAPSNACGGCWERAVAAFLGTRPHPKTRPCEGAVAIAGDWRAPTAASPEMITRTVADATCARAAHAKAPVELCTVAGAGHAFPGSTIGCKRGTRGCDAYLAQIGEPAQLDLPDVAARFLLAP